MNVKSVSNAKWNNASQTSLDCDVEFEGYAQPVAYTAIDNSGQAVVQAVWDAAKSGTVAAYVDPPAPPFNPTTAINNALAAGVIITCTGNSSLNGTYSATTQSKTDLLGALSYYGLKGNFFGGSSTMTWYDQNGTAHSFNATQFEEFAEAIGAYIAAVENWAFSGGSGSAPSNAITIA
jgi:hypothetical protein